MWMKTKECQWCGKKFVIYDKTKSGTKYCSEECRVEGYAEHSRYPAKLERKKKKRAYTEDTRDKKLKLCDRKDCIYAGAFGDGTLSCDYLIIMGEPRGCLPSECDKYVARRNKRKEA